MLCARRFLSLLACAASATGRFLLLQSCAFLPSPRRPTAAAATSILEGSLDDQAISILAQAKLRILATPYALKFSVLEEKRDKDYEDSTTRIGDQDRILFVAWSRAIIGGHSSGVRKLRSNPEPNLEASGHFVAGSESRGQPSL